MAQCKISDKRVNLLVFVMLGLYPLVGMGVDLVAPSLPAIARNLNVSGGLAKNLIGIYLFGAALGNFVIGFLSDAYGRRKFLLMGMLAFVIFSVLPALFPSISMLLVSRFFQGVTLGAFGVLIRAIFADILPEKRLLYTMPMVGTMWAIGPIIGPVIGSYLQFYFDWEAGFYFFAIFGLIALGLFWTLLPETHHQRHALSLANIRASFIKIITHRVYIGIVLMMAFSYSILIVFNTLGPFLVQVEMGYSTIYFGHLALIFGLVFFIVTLVGRQLLKHYEAFLIYKQTLIIALLVGLLMLGVSFMFPKNVMVLIIANVLLFSATAILYPIGMAKGLSLFRHLAGSASAVMNLINFSLTALCASMMGFIDASTVFVLIRVYFVLIILCILVYRFLICPKNVIISQ